MGERKRASIARALAAQEAIGRSSFKGDFEGKSYEPVVQAHEASASSRDSLRVVERIQHKKQKQKAAQNEWTETDMKMCVGGSGFVLLFGLVMSIELLTEGWGHERLAGFVYLLFWWADTSFLIRFTVLPRLDDYEQAKANPKGKAKSRR